MFGSVLFRVLLSLSLYFTFGNFLSRECEENEQLEL